jgi:hypothetical protein
MTSDNSEVVLSKRGAYCTCVFTVFCTEGGKNVIADAPGIGKNVVLNFVLNLGTKSL